MKPSAIAAVIFILFATGLVGGYWYLTQNSNPGGTTETTPVGGDVSEHGKAIVVPANAVICEEHQVPEMICPFCQPSLIAERGHCGTHNVAEALCTTCSPALIMAFKAEGDWCAEHGLPESQCALCGGGAGAAGETTAATTPGGEICGEHQVPESMCPFCDPSLVETLGHCGGHDVPEAYCTRCNAALIPAFKAEGDWCAEHELPESQCLTCNPDSGG